MATAAPTISPAAGRRPSVATRIALAAVAGLIYYTLDGSTPTASSAMYDGPMEVARNRTLKAIAISGGVSSSVISAGYTPAEFGPTGAVWLDTDGNAIDCHGIGILDNTTRDGKWYMYGFTLAGKTTDDLGNAISCYSSYDLLNWTNEGTMIASTVNVLLERPKVLYCASTGKYVMHWHTDNNNYSTARLGIAQADSPAGPWTTYTTSYNPGSVGVHDMTTFIDPATGTAYLVFDGADNVLRIGTFASDFLSVSGVYSLSQVVEAPCITKVGSVYYIIGSGTAGWASTTGYCLTASSMAGPWTLRSSPYPTIVGQDGGTSYQTQGSYLLQIPGRDGSLILFGDRFSNPSAGGSLQNSTLTVLPVTVTSTQATVTWSTGFSLDDYFPTTAAPAACTGLASQFGDDEATLTWTNGTTSGVLRAVERDTDEDFTRPVLAGLVSASATSWTDTEAENGGRYFYRVRTWNAAGSSFSATAEAVLPSRNLIEV